MHREKKIKILIWLGIKGDNSVLSILVLISYLYIDSFSS